MINYSELIVVAEPISMGRLSFRSYHSDGSAIDSARQKLLVGQLLSIAPRHRYAKQNKVAIGQHRFIWLRQVSLCTTFMASPFPRETVTEEKTMLVKVHVKTTVVKIKKTTVVEVKQLETKIVFTAVR